MDTMEAFCKSEGIPLTEEQLVAESYIRSRGAKWLIDYGYSNVISRANMLFEVECEKALELGLIQ